MVTNEDKQTAEKFGREIGLITSSLLRNLPDAKTTPSDPTTLKNTEIETILQERRKLATLIESRNVVSAVLTGTDIQLISQYDQFFADKISKSKKSKFRHDPGAQPIFEALVKNMKEIVVARVDPIHKYTLLRCFQALRHVTAVTGLTLADCQVLKGFCQQ